MLLCFALINKLVHPIQALSRALEAIVSKNGDLTVRLPVTSHDEIGTLAHRFNLFVTSIQAIVSDVASETDALVIASGNLDAIAGTMTQHAGDTADRSGTVAAAGLQMSTTMGAISSASEDTTTHLVRVTTATREMETTINHIASETQTARAISDRAVSAANIASTRIQELTASAKKINNVAETITEISCQTNLLALNATIEASRAGSAGKGFAVVANEIKALSKQTAEATQGIHAHLAGMEETTRTTTKGIQHIAGIIQEIDAIISDITTAVGQQSATTKEVAGRLIRTSKRIGDVNANLAEGALVAQEISGDISEIDTASQGILDTACSVGRDAESLAEIGARLKLRIAQFSI